MYKVIDETKTKLIIEIPVKYKTWVFERLIPVVEVSPKELKRLQKLEKVALKEKRYSVKEVRERYCI